MNGRKYLLQQKLKKDKERFTKKLYLSNQINFFTTQIKSFSSKIAENRAKRNITTTHQENTEDILKHYIAELNFKIYPDSYKINYGDENIRMNLSNLNYLTYFQKFKKDTLNNDRRTLEDNSKDLMYYIEEHRRKKIKKQLKSDINVLEFYEEKRKEFEEINEIIPELLNKVELFEKNFKESKFLYEQAIKKNKILELKLESQKNLNKKLKRKTKYIIDENEIIFEKKNFETGIGDYAQRKKNFENMRTLSEDNFLFNYKSENFYEIIDEIKNPSKKANIHSLLFDSPRFIGYKSPMSFLNYNKIKLKKLIKNEKPINPYNYLNIFTNNKRYNSISDFMENFNSINDKKISFNRINTLITNEKTSTKINTISSLSSKKSKNKKIIKKRLFSSQQLNKEKEKYGIIIFRDYLVDLITYQKKLIKNLKNNIAEEIRSNNQIKSFIGDCINDINIELFDLKEKIEDDEEKEEQIKYNENLLYILSFIFDNCFSGIKHNIKKLINKSRNNNINKEENIIKIKKNFSFNDK